MQQLLLGLALGFSCGALCLWGAYVWRLWPFKPHRQALTPHSNKEDELNGLRRQLRQVCTRLEEVKRTRKLITEEKRTLAKKLNHARNDGETLQIQLGEAIKQNEEMQMQLAKALGRSNELHSRLETAGRQEELFHKELIKLSLANDKLRKQLHASFRHNDSLMIKLTDFAGRADSLHNQLIATRQNNDELQAQLEEANRLLNQLERLEQDNHVLHAKLEQAENLDLPDRFAEVIENLSQTKLVIESAMSAFSSLQNKTVAVEMLSDGLLIGSSAVHVSELEHQQRELEDKLAKTSRLLADVWSKYRVALSRLDKLSTLESENQDLYLRLRVSDTKVSILRDKLFDVARLREVDDLQRINGITAEHERRLRMAGIDTFEHLSHLKPSQLRRLVKRNDDQGLDYRQWIDEAKQLAGQSVYVPAWLAPRPVRSGRSKRQRPVTRPAFGRYLDQRLSDALADDKPN